MRAQPTIGRGHGPATARQTTPRNRINCGHMALGERPTSGDICSCTCPDIYSIRSYFERYAPDTSVPIMIDGVYPDTGMGQFLLATYLGIVYALDIICVSCISYRYDPRYISFLLPLFVSNCIFWEKKKWIQVILLCVCASSAGQSCDRLLGKMGSLWHWLFS